eukprot:TRINITY_DN12387_c0_g2_i3.p1 TRINITY_DN12387_c0_g2~~TRINITY_DN12387_c0_g2_i3.p1  ORF type:complete len:536 (+),score=67.62 TRINITY_DN12387_c0_g2_i3:143-1750(+)
MMLAASAFIRHLFARHAIFFVAIGIGAPLGILSAAMKYQEWDQVIEVQASAASTLSFLMSVFVAFRASQAYQRFWEGTTALYRIRGHFFDVVSSLVAFSRCSQQDGAKVDEFRHSVIRLFSLLETLMLADLADESAINGSEKAFDFELIDPFYFDEETISHLKTATFPVELVIQWIQTLIVEGLDTKILCAPPPICTRVFQEMQAGITWFHDAMRISEVPIPIPYRVSTQIVLIINCAVMPFAACQWSTLPVVCGILCLCQVGAFVILFEISGEMENPFGCDANDLEVEKGHIEFNNKLCVLLTTRMQFAPKRRTSQPEGCGTDGEERTAGTLKDLFGKDLFGTVEHMPCDNPVIMFAKNRSERRTRSLISKCGSSVALRQSRLSTSIFAHDAKSFRSEDREVTSATSSTSAGLPMNSTIYLKKTVKSMEGDIGAEVDMDKPFPLHFHEVVDKSGRGVRPVLDGSSAENTSTNTAQDSKAQLPQSEDLATITETAIDVRVDAANSHRQAEPIGTYNAQDFKVPQMPVEPPEVVQI